MSLLRHPGFAARCLPLQSASSAVGEIEGMTPAKRGEGVPISFPEWSGAPSRTGYWNFRYRIERGSDFDVIGESQSRPAAPGR